VGSRRKGALMADQILIGQAQGVNRNLSDLVSVMRDAFPLHSSRGSFTMSAAASSVITDAGTKSSSLVVLMPTNAAAAALLAGSHSLYVSARTDGVSFTLSTADAAAAAGTETFEYIIISIG
jgi:hypothetical protein